MSPVATVKTLKIDGRDVSGRQEETILDVARQNGIFIPRLCEMDGLSDVPHDSFKSVITLASMPRPMMSQVCAPSISSQTRRQRVHRMQRL